MDEYVIYKKCHFCNGTGKNVVNPGGELPCDKCNGVGFDNDGKILEIDDFKKIIRKLNKIMEHFEIGE